MAAKTCSIPFTGTAEQEAKLKEVIASHKGDKGALMPVLQVTAPPAGQLQFQPSPR